MRVLAAMELVGASPKTIERFTDCGRFTRIQKRQDTGELRLRGSKCRHRFCRRCGQATSLNVAENLGHMILDAKLRCSHATLTLKHRDESPDKTRERLYRCFKNMRNDKEWKRYIKGGAAFCQGHVSTRDDRWHIHFHLIIEHHYFPQEELSRLWLKHTGDSSNVYIERVHNVQAAITEVTRYVASPIDKHTAQNVLHLAEAMIWTERARLCFTFGEWRGKKLHEKRPEDPTIIWEDVDYLGDVIWRASRGNQDAIAMLQQLRKLNVNKTGPPTLFHRKLYLTASDPQPIG